jgi:hypothetical protein
MAAGRPLDAVPLLQETLADSRRVLGSTHPHTLTCESSLGDAYRDADRLLEAAALQEQVIHKRLQVMGESHPRTLLSWASLGETYRRLGRVEETVSIVSVALAKTKALHPDHPYVLGARHTLAVAYLSADRRTEAVTALRAVLLARRRVLGHSHPDTLTTMLALADALGARWFGRRAAERLAREALLACRANLDADHPLTVLAGREVKRLAWGHSSNRQDPLPEVHDDRH